MSRRVCRRTDIQLHKRWSCKMDTKLSKNECIQSELEIWCILRVSEVSESVSEVSEDGEWEKENNQQQQTTTEVT